MSLTIAEQLATWTAMPATALLSSWVEASGGELRSAVRERVSYRPGRDATVRFAATVRRGEAVTSEGWVLHAGPTSAAAAWRVRDDPHLPGLRTALNRDAIAGLLAGLGLPTHDLASQLLAYRPLRRAVVVVTSGEHRVFVKCLRPGAVAPLHTRHDAFAAARLPTPHTLGYDEKLGLVVLPALAGEPLRAGLLASAPAMPAPGDVLQLADRVREVDLDLPARAPLRQARGHAALLRAVVPGSAGQVDELLGLVEPERPADTSGAVVHGDFYDAQVLVQGRRIVGLVDIDGAGLGQAEDDVATLLAHLHVLTTIGPAAVHGWLAALEDALPGTLDPGELRRRTGAGLLGLCTWPHSRHLPGWEEQTRGLLDLTSRVLTN